MKEKIQVAKTVIDETCKKHMVTEGSFKNCPFNHNCQQCTYNEGLATRVVSALEAFDSIKVEGGKV
jgi:hypothetical protein